MKRKGLFITVLSTMLLGVGVFAGVSSVSENAPVEKAEAYKVPSKFFIQFNNNTWKETSSKVCFYLFNNDVSKDAWCDYVYPDGKSKYMEYTYDLDFTPKGAIAFRVNKTDTRAPGSWMFGNDRGDSAIWSTTNDITVDDVIWLGDHYENSKWTVSGSWGFDDITIKGGASQSWSTPTVDFKLTNYKTTGAALEVYGEYTLPANTYFKSIRGTEWIGTYSAHDSIKSNFNGGGSSNIHNIESGTYEFYFDYEAKSLYITDPVYAAADEWAQYFLNNVGCDSTGVNLPTGWSDCATEYAKLKGASKDLIYGATAKQNGSYIEKAVARYDHALVSHPTLDRFIKNSSNVSRAVSSPFGIQMETNNTQATITIVVTTLISVVAVGGFFLLKRKAR